MKLSVLHPSRHPVAVLVAALGLAFLAAPAVQAFTLEGPGSNSGDGAKFADPAERAARFGSGDGANTYRQGNTTFQFGPVQQTSPDARFNADSQRLFSPLGRPGDPGR